MFKIKRPPEQNILEGKAPDPLFVLFFAVIIRSFCLYVPTNSSTEFTLQITGSGGAEFHQRST